MATCLQSFPDFRNFSGTNKNLNRQVVVSTARKYIRQNGFIFHLACHFGLATFCTTCLFRFNALNTVLKLAISCRWFFDEWKNPWKTSGWNEVGKRETQATGPGGNWKLGPLTSWVVSGHSHRGVMSVSFWRRCLFPRERIWNYPQVRSSPNWKRICVHAWPFCVEHCSTIILAALHAVLDLTFLGEKMFPRKCQQIWVLLPRVSFFNRLFDTPEEGN